jgi:hypothetical protein
MVVLLLLLLLASSRVLLRRISSDHFKSDRLTFRLLPACRPTDRHSQDAPGRFANSQTNDQRRHKVKVGAELRCTKFKVV